MNFHRNFHTISHMTVEVFFDLNSRWELRAPPLSLFSLSLSPCFILNLSPAPRPHPRHVYSHHIVLKRNATFLSLPHTSLQGFLYQIQRVTITTGRGTLSTFQTFFKVSPNLFIFSFLFFFPFIPSSKRQSQFITS